MPPIRPSAPRASDRAAYVRSLLPLLAPVVAFLVCAVGYAVALRPAIARYHAVRERASFVQQRDALAASLAAIGRGDAAIAAVPADRMEALTALAPSGEDVPGLFATIDAAAQRAGVAVTSMEVTREDASVVPLVSGAKALSVGIGVRNVDYAKLKAFLDVLAASRRLIDVRSVQFTAQSLGATVRVRAYSIE